ncbi:MAG: FMN-binding negative transcriptional regulator, partial [Flavobacteriaceae bacterium]|nr:FMN-binding negative transcriptional regulator [Flavobacteriaceae bacterium]
MKYPPPHHQQNDREKLLKVIKKYPLATLISVDNNTPYITHLPLIYREADGKLVGHIDIYNPQTNLLRDNNEVTIIFTGPDCYISPAV